MKEYNKAGGSLYNIPELEARIGKERFDDKIYILNLNQ